ncbi:HAD family hydrolase [uncultured Secundilactobacillus sp.]|uniref:HAD family hydrolase n=1 Tax=uncultured Secundilactobacillus sp. TaxID=2813935 RepID=UPI00258EFCC6|nr:HAD family hydrolase [uncultured Secundilactobacillus sp.]
MKNFIFDIDGTLLDTEAMYMKSLQKVLTARGIDRPYEALTQTFGIPSRDALVALAVPEADIETIMAAWRDMIPHFQQEVRVYPGVTKMLAALNDSAGVSVAVMTSKQKYELKRDMAPFGLQRYFSEFVVAEDAKRGKPAPDPILVAMARLKAQPEETVYIGDTQYDLQAAHAAGIKFGLVAWGAKNQPGVAASDYVFAFPEEIVPLASELNES